MSSDVIPSSGPGLISRQVQAMALAWAKGQRVLAEEVLAQFPGLGDEDTVRLIYEEVSLRRELGEEVATTEVVNRYPRYKDELEVLLGCDRMLRPFSRGAKFPSAPGELGPFRLLSELGRGASGTTYLAEEPALGGRLVVLKVIPDDEVEHLSLARLQHTHIIPLFSEQRFPDRGLRALCMPYLRGTTLARLLDAMAETPPSARIGRHLVEALDRAAEWRPHGFWCRRRGRTTKFSRHCQLSCRRRAGSLKPRRRGPYTTEFLQHRRAVSALSRTSVVCRGGLLDRGVPG